MIQNIIDFFRHGLWNFKGEGHPAFIRWGVKQLKVLLFTLQGFDRHQTSIRAAALSFFAMMSFVPIFAMVFGIAKGFGLDTRISEFLAVYLYDYQPILDQLLGFVHKYLEKASGGIIAGTGFFILIWSVMKVFGNIEKAFNNIWEIKKTRPLSRKITGYLSIILLFPVLWALYVSISNAFKNTLLLLADHNELLFFLVQAVILFGKLFIFWLTFAIIYSALPYTKVNLKPAIGAAIIAGTAYMLFLDLYIYAQASILRFNVIYGSFAAVPLFLLWLNISWHIILFGAELSFTYQNISKYESERESYDVSHTFRLKATVLIMSRIVKNFIHGEPPMTSGQLARQIDIPIGIVREALFELEKAGLLLSVESESLRSHMYTPSKDVNGLSICSVIEAIDNRGVSELSGAAIEELPEYIELSGILEEFREQACRSERNKLLKEL